MQLTRRALLGGLAILPLGSLFARSARASLPGFGPLVPDPNHVLDLPAGFTYRVIERAGDVMTDGLRVPSLPDGMGCFAGPPGMLVLMRNHEVDGAAGLALPQAYDPSKGGGVSRVLVDATTFTRVASNLVLTGTVRNCAGGTSPWGWLSCEETFDATHGYVFLCDPAAASVQPPLRIPAYGHFNHEAACVDPATLIAYLTEDRGDSCVYRFVPASPAQPFVGKLQALRVVGTPRFATSSAMTVGAPVAVDWVDIDTPDPGTDSVRAEAQSKGAAVFVRGEGIFFAGGAVYICSTSGGPVGGGQIFRLQGAELVLLAQSTNLQDLDQPDNICVAPWGDVFLAEDGGGEQYVRVLDASGAVQNFARNALSGSEFAGVCFSPDGRALFVNIQGDGLTLVVTGPFPAAPVAIDAGAPDAATVDAGVTADADAADAAPSEPDAALPKPDAPRPELDAAPPPAGEAQPASAPTTTAASVPDPGSRSSSCAATPGRPGSGAATLTAVAVVALATLAGARRS